MLKIRAVTGPDQYGGKGVFADQSVSAGQVVWRYNPMTTRTLTINEYRRQLAEGGPRADLIARHSYPGEVEVGGRMERILFRDNDIGTYMNHNDDPNFGYITDPAHPNYAERDEVMIALRFIRKDDELTCDYRNFVPDLTQWTDVAHCASFLEDMDKTATQAA